MTESPFGPEYPKINTVFKRDMADRGSRIIAKLKVKDFEALAKRESRRALAATTANLDIVEIF